MSVLDRLIDEEPKSGVEGPMTRSESLRRLKTAVRRDLEWLLNAREPVQPPPDGAVELAKSVYCYGLPDLCSMNLISTRNRTDLARLMESIIAVFEPRLLGTKVSLVPVRSRPTTAAPLRDRRAASHRSDARACELRHRAGRNRR